VEYCRLGSSGLQVSVAGLGCSSFGRQCDATQAAAIVARALDLGVNFLDTADAYNAGLSEEYTGRAIRGRRGEVVLASKFGRPMGEGPLRAGASRRYIFDAVQASLRRLGVDYLDLYQMHIPDPATPIEETLRALDDLVRRGDVRYVGCSNFAAWQMVEAQWVARTEHLTPFISAQNLYNLLDRYLEREVVPVCAHYGLGLLPYFPLAGGFLTGRYQPGAPVPAESRLATARLYGQPLAGQIVSDANFARLAALAQFAEARGHGIAELALAWLAAQPTVSSVIAGASSPAQVEANVRALAWRLTPSDLAALDAAASATAAKQP
jgi:aryl-alcohol dehydrogenase-like predicted oxidoreductase